MRGLVFLAALGSLPVLGYGVLPGRLWGWTNAPTRVALAAAIGALILTFEMLVLTAAQIPWTVPRLVGIPVAVSLIRVWKQRSTRRQGDRGTSAGTWFSAGLTAAALLLVAFAALTARATSSDLVLFWGAKAERFASARAFDVDYLRHPAHFLMHSDYPPVLTCLWAYAALVAGKFPWGAAMATLPIFLALSVLAFWSIAAGRREDSDAADSAALMAALFGFVFLVGLTAGNADPVLFFFETLALSLIAFAPSQPWSMAIASASLAGAVLTKIEGAFFAAGVLVAATLIGRFRDWRRVAVLSAGPCLALIGWVVWSRVYGLTDAYTPHPGASLTLPRFVAVTRALASVADYQSFYLPWLVTLAFLVRRNLSWGSRLAAVAAASVLVLDILIYLVTPQDASVWVGWSGQRLLLTPLLCLFIAGAASPSKPNASAVGGPAPAVP